MPMDAAYSRNAAHSTKQMSNRFRHYRESLGRRVVSVFQVGEIMCCELEGDILVCGQIAEEHGNVDIVLGPMTAMPPMFGPAFPRPYRPMQMVLVGRMFQGLLTSSRTGDVSLDFGLYQIRFVREDAIAVLVRTDRFASEQLRHFENFQVID